MADSTGIDKSNVVALNRWLDDRPGISNREAARQLGIHESYIRRAKSARPEGVKMRLKIADVQWTSQTQPRVKICEETVERYATAKRDGAVFPIPVVFTDGQTYWGGDGAHRTAADVVLGLSEAEFEVRHGTDRDAFDHAVLANKLNGLPFNRDDRKRIALRLIADRGKSNRQVAKEVGVDEGTIRNWRSEAEKPSLIDWRAVNESFAADRDGGWGDVETTADGLAVVDGDDSYPDPDPAPTPPSVAVHRPSPKPTDPDPSGAENSAPDDEWEGETEEPVPLTDDEWLDTLPTYAKLSGAARDVFRRDALYFRSLTETDHYARVKREAMKDGKSIGLRGRFQVKAVGFFRAKHPASWLVCGDCEGAGCDTCRRGGYAID